MPGTRKNSKLAAKSPVKKEAKKTRISKVAQCIRKTANTTRLGLTLMPDNKAFDASKLEPAEMSAKFVAIIQKIKELDDADMAAHGKRFKHFIFTDIRESAYGAKALAAFLINAGFDLRMKREQKFMKRYGKLIPTSGGDTVYVKKAADPTGGNGFALLQSLPLWTNPLSVTSKKAILKAFNERPENVNGEHLRIIILDSKYKEGIDLFDVKYVHLVEPAIATSDLKQAVGRATRFCGQKGLPFLPRRGWPLHVFIYDTQLPQRPPFADESGKGSVGAHDLMMAKSGLDIALLNITKELTILAIRCAVDYDLNFKINNFSIEEELLNPADVAAVVVEVVPPADAAAGPKVVVHKVENLSAEDIEACGKRKSTLFPFTLAQMRSAAKDLKLSVSAKADREEFCALIPKHPAYLPYLLTKLGGSAAPAKPVVALSSKPSAGGAREKTLAAIAALPDEKFQKKIGEMYAKFKWQSPVVKNGCEKVGDASQQGKAVSFTQTQDFVRHYLTPASPFKGLLAWHSVGTGKTCMAVAAATTEFEKAGYSILWVTRNALMSDVYKNIFGSVCSIPVMEQIEKGAKIPEDITKAKRMLSRMWSPPISYRTFQNALQGKNELGRMLQKKNRDDPLHKTFLIMDEVHKLQDGDLSASEAADFKVIQEYIYKSYETSGANSVRPLLMTATPITDTPHELFEILNTLIGKKEDRLVPFSKFRETYTNPEGVISAAGIKYFKDHSRGLISYLNREFDPTTFSQPVFQTIKVEMADPHKVPSLDELAEKCKPSAPEMMAAAAAAGYVDPSSLPLESLLAEAFVEADCNKDIENELTMIDSEITRAETEIADLGEIAKGKAGKDPAMVKKRAEKEALTKKLGELKALFAKTKRNAVGRRAKCERANREMFQAMKKYTRKVVKPGARKNIFKECYKKEKLAYKLRATRKSQIKAIEDCFDKKIKRADKFVPEKQFLEIMKKLYPE